ncbi:SDR family oxidoreductase [Aestuariibacter sp. AA17]|uniref:SDR family oxidoreductase n=1 Tax=Fluctibacter corallii TaxID=2984329 RepID=A0ABT3A4V4_9ALTE|nr:SDR family oxidoreductase [Aestuariibacter sp. AA17]MCV2883282.1 SDR family oxidoreductase [Aestuariibacter sp. AA17]
MKVLVTGASGYIGSVLVPLLLEASHEVIAIDRFFFGDCLLESSHLTKIQMDSRCIDPALFKEVDAVIDLVAISNDPSGDAFAQATTEINFESRKRTAELAKSHGVKRYILPSSCSIYGFQDSIVDETASVNPLTRYAVANYEAENAVLPLSGDNFVVTVIRQSTIYGYSPRMRFDLAINGMTYGAWDNGKLPLMRDGTQYRPMLHVKDTARLMIALLTADADKVNGEIFNAGSDAQNYRLGELGEIVAEKVSSFLGQRVDIEWYGDPDHRSYRVNFDKVVEQVGWQPLMKAEDGVTEICAALSRGELLKTSKTITLEWYKRLESEPQKFSSLLLNNKMLNLH